MQLKVFVMSSGSAHLDLLQLVAVVANYWSQSSVKTLQICVQKENWRRRGQTKKIPLFFTVMSHLGDIPPSNASALSSVILTSVESIESKESKTSIVLFVHKPKLQTTSREANASSNLLITSE